MGDASVSPGTESMNIDTLRKLALLSMPKRQGRNLTLSNPSLKSDETSVFPSPAAKPPEGKEEGELSSDDDAEGATATFASVEPASNQDQAALKSHVPSQGSTKEMLGPGAHFTRSNSNEGLSTASVAEAFLASLRIPVPKSSRAPGDDKKEDDFVIKFDEDSDTDGEHQLSLSSSSTQLGSNAEKTIPSSVSLPNTTPVPQAFSAGANQNPSGLKSEIDRMKKQIAAMERSKGKPPVLSVVGKSTRVVSADTTRPLVSTATDPKSVVQVGIGNLRPVLDLESLRLQIAAKESELQQRRQRLAVRGPEASKVASDVKGTGAGVPTTTVPSLSRTNRDANHLGGPPANSASNVSAEKTLVPIRKEVLNHAEGLIALASVGPSGVCLPSYKRDVRLSGLDSCIDLQIVSEDGVRLPTSRAGTYPNSSIGRQVVSQGTKRPHMGPQSLENPKIARIDACLPLPGNLVGANTSREPTLPEMLPVTVNGTCKTLPVQASNQIKRKVDDIEISYKAVVETQGPSNSVGSDMSKKLKLTTKVVPGDVSRVERFLNPTPSGTLQSLQAPLPNSSTGLEQAQLHCEKVCAKITSSSSHAVSSAAGTDVTRRSVSKEGEDAIRVQKAGIVTEEASPRERFCGANNTAAYVQPTEAPISVKGSAKIVANEDGHVPKILKPRFQSEGSHALPALAGVSVHGAGVTEPVALTEPSVKKHDVVPSTQQVREGIKVMTGMYLRPSSVLLPPEAHLEHRAQQSLGFGHSYADNWDVDPDAETFEQLQAEEELVDKELEEAQEERHRCELKERVARKEYREAQRALREVNAQCDFLNQRKEFLLSRIHLVEGRQYSRKLSSRRKPWLISSVDNASLRLTGLEVTPPCSPKRPATSVEHCAVSLPLHQPSREAGSCGADGGQVLAVQVGESRRPPAAKEAGATTVVQILRKDSLPTQVDEDVGSISRVALSDEDPVVHGRGGDIVFGRKVLDSGYADKLGNSASASQNECVDLSAGAAKTGAISSCSFRRELQRTAVTMLEARAYDNCSPDGQHVAFNAGVLRATGSERTMIEGKQVQVKSDTSLPVSGNSKQEDKDTLAITGSMTGVSHCVLSTPVMAHEHVQTFTVGINTAPGVQDKQAVLGSCASTVETFMEGNTNPSQGPCIVAGNIKGTLSVVSGGDVGKNVDSNASMTTCKEESSVPEKMVQVFAKKGTVESVSKIVQDGSSSEGKIGDVSTPVLLLPASSSAVEICNSLQFELVHNIQSGQGPKFAASEGPEVDSAVDLGLKDLNRSTHDLAVPSAIKNKANDVPYFQGRDDSDDQKKGEDQGVHSSVIDRKCYEASEMGKQIAVSADGLVDHSPQAGSLGKQESNNSGDLATDYQGFSSEGISLNGVEELELGTGISLTGDVTEGGCQVLDHQEFVFSEPLSEENKTSPTASNSGSSQQVLSETKRGSREESEGLSTCTDHVRVQEHNKTMSSNKSTEEEAVCQSADSAGGCGDMDTMEPYEEIHSREKLEMSKKVNELQCMENLRSMQGREVRCYLTQPGSGPDLQRQKTVVDVIANRDCHTLPAIDTRHEVKEQYSVTFQSANFDNVVRTSDCCSSEVEVTNDLRDSRPTENGFPPVPDPYQQPHVVVPLDSNPQTVSKFIPDGEDVVRVDGVDRTFCPNINDHHHHQKLALESHGLEDVRIVGFEENLSRKFESGHRDTSDRETGNDRQEWQSSDAVELKEANFEKEVENSKLVEVEFFRKALLKGNVFRRSSEDDEAVAMMGVQTPRRDTSEEQILPQLHHHLLDQRLDMVQVGTPVDVREGHSLESPLMAVAADIAVVVAQSAQVECTAGAKAAEVTGGKKAEVVSNMRIKGFSDESSASEHWVPSAVSFVSLECIRGIVASPSKVPVLEKSSNVEDKEYLPAVGSPAVLPRYESPLTIFRAYRSLPQFARAMQLSGSSNTWNHAINPHKPLCRFEHRGQCRNEHCPWQHADDYTLSAQFSPEIQNKEPREALIFDAKTDDNPLTRPKVGSFVGSFPAQEKSGVGSPDKLQACGSLLSWNGVPSEGLPSRKLHDFEMSVPTYRIGYYTLKAEDPSSMRLGISGMQRKVKTEIYHSFLLSPSIHRTLPSDFPCLLGTSTSRLSTIENSNASQVPHRRYRGKLQEERVFNESGSLHVSKDVEMWLELALNHIDFDISSDKPKARDEALCILSRGLETKQNSVTLWMAYSCLFHTRRDNPESDDMFQFAIQYNPGSYELWLLYINSRPDLPSRLEAYERAIAALVEKGIHVELFREDSSACLLDIALQMLYCMCISGCTEDALLWVEDLIHDASTTEDKCHRGSTFTLLSNLTPHDACVLWISCAYLSACAEMPEVITRRLGCKHDLLYALDWDTRANSEQLACLRVLRIMNIAASSARGCLSLQDPHPPMSDENNHSKEALGVNYVQCLAFYEGLESAARASHHLIHLYPTSVELILLHARIEERRVGADAGLQVFEEAVSHWPVDQPGIQRLWNQYAVHGLVWGGNHSAHKALSKSIPNKVQKSSDLFEDPPSTLRISQAIVPSTVSADVSTVTNLERVSSGIWNEVREHYLSLTSSFSRRSDESTSLHSWQVHDLVYALLNLALVEALSGDRVALQSTINKAMKFAVSDRDSRQWWKELASLQFSGAGVKEHRMLSLLDKCKTESYSLSLLKPLSLKVLEDLKRPQVRKFFVDLLGLLPVDHSLLNSILEICYGSSLLPFESLALKDVFHFAEGILEAMPGNVDVALSLCKVVFQEGGSPRSKPWSSAIWASALLVSSLQQSCPPAPEVYWVEAGVLLGQLRKEKSLEEYYLHALVKYPFSAALRHGLEEARLKIQESNGSGGLQQADMVREVAGLTEG